MDHFLTLNNIVSLLSILGTIFVVFLYFKKPQIDGERNDAVLKTELAEVRSRITELAVSFQSHVVSDQTSFGMLNQHVIEVDKSVVKLTTIIDERIPKLK